MAHDLTQHSPLGGSGMRRWVPCPGSVRLSHGVEDEESEYAARGKAAHALAERALHDDDVDAWQYVGDLLEGGVVDKPMADGVQVYLNAVRSRHVNFDAALEAGCALCHAHGAWTEATRLQTCVQ